MIIEKLLITYIKESVQKYFSKFTIFTLICLVSAVYLIFIIYTASMWLIYEKLKNIFCKEILKYMTNVEIIWLKKEKCSNKTG